jgi:hypothetical protein
MVSVRACLRAVALPSQGRLAGQALVLSRPPLQRHVAGGLSYLLVQDTEGLARKPQTGKAQTGHGSRW